MLGPLGWLVKWPVLPVTGVIRLAEVLAAEAEKKLTDPMEVRRQLEAIDAARASGEITPAEAREAQQVILNRLTRRPA